MQVGGLLVGRACRGGIWYNRRHDEAHMHHGPCGTPGAVRGRRGTVRGSTGGDTVQTPLSFPPPWSDGWISWRIPMGWISPLYTLADIVKPDPVTRQRYEITSEGTVSIIKSNHEIKRSVSNNIWLDGVKVYPREEQNR